MKEKKRFFAGRLRYYLSLILFFSAAFFQHPAYSAMNDYCITPPFLVGGVYPNLLLMLDNSGSMYDLAYIAGSTGTAPTYSCTGGGTASTSYCMDNTYTDTAAYIGYFDQNTIYSYSSGKFVTAAAIPASCTYSTSYMCVNLSGGAVSQFVAKGKFLNWLSASKFDVEKQILTGGKFLPGNCSATTATACSRDNDCPTGETCTGTLQSETRGCVGRRFIKEIPTADFTSASTDITFAVRGPSPLDPDFASSNFVAEVRGGETKIEIYQTAFDNQDCQCAVYNWVNGSYGQASTDTKGCLDVTGRGNTTSGRELATFNHSLQVCWQIKQNIQDAVDAGKTLATITDADIFPNSLNYNDLLVACANAYGDFGGDPRNITNKGSGNYICTAYDATVNPDATHLSPAAPYNVDGTDTIGFIGRCWQGSSSKFTGNDTCVKRELLHYCMGQAYGEVVDPSQGASDTDTTGNIPAVIMDAGVRALGDPLSPSGSADKFFNAKIAVSAEPKGVVQQYASTARIGAMSFNYNGSASECGVAGTGISCPKRCSVTTTQVCSVNTDCPAGETCNAIADNDAAQIISYIGAPLGDHTTGLVSSIDILTAKSWTPFAEAFYDAIGYFARSNDYTSSPGTSRGVDAVHGSLRINATDFDNNKNPSQYRCQSNNVLIITDGSSTADQNAAANSLSALYTYDNAYGYDTTNTCPSFAGSRNLDELAWLAKNRNIKTFSTSSVSTAAPAAASEYIRTYVVYSGSPTSTEPGKCDPRTLMCNTSVAGGGTATGGGCSAGGGSSQFFPASDPSSLKTAISDAFSQIAAKTASGTASSVLASGEGSGANIIQAIFFPDRQIGGTDIKWTSVMNNLWYYIDPQLGNSTVREDTDADSTLELKDDDIVDFYFDPVDNQTKINVYADADGNGVVDSATPDHQRTFDDLKSLWEAGKLLFKKSAASRNIYTNLDTSHDITDSHNSFSTSNDTSLQPLMNVSSSASADNLINYIRGSDAVGAVDGMAVRSRTVTIASVDSTPRVWKLGDIVNSTPRIVSALPLNRYDVVYRDTSYKTFVDSTADRGMVFAGANDGMLHAFKFGKVVLYNDSYKKAELINPDTGHLCDPVNDAVPCGSEAWAFIPKNALPYLKYLADPTYSHLFYVDNTPYIFDASIQIDALDEGNAATSTCNSASYANYWECNKTENSWRTVLIGGMRLGGASRNLGAQNDGQACTECVTSPVSGVGYSSYFAMDVTDPASPKLLWEFRADGLNFSTTAPAIVRVGDRGKDGRWFAIFASGPSGYVNPGHQFLGITEHDWWSNTPYPRGNLLLYVVDVKTGTLVRTINTGKVASFGGSLFNSTTDLDLNYKDDAVYFGYTQRNPANSFSLTYSAQAGTANTITLSGLASSTDDAYKGKFIHLASTHETKLITSYDGSSKVATVDSPWKLTQPASGTQYNLFAGWTQGGVMRLVTKEDIDPSHWVVSTVISGIGPVTAAVTRLLNTSTGMLRLYFGTGRYYYRVGDVMDDANSGRQIFGLVDTCYSYNAATSTGAYDTTSAGCTGTTYSSDSSLCDATDPATDCTDSDYGWHINLDSCSDASGAVVDCGDSSVLYRAERLVSDPLANLSGAVFFTTNSPTADVCSYGGQTHLWAVRYDTGGALPGSILKGKALIQLSTGSIKEIDLSDAFQGTGSDASAKSASSRGYRRSMGFSGLSPLVQGLSLIEPPKPIDMIMHIRKK